MLPGIWSRITLDTFPENFCVINLTPVHTGEALPSQAVIQAYGQGGLREVAQSLSQAIVDGTIRYAGFRVSQVATSNLEPESQRGPPLFFWASWGTGAAREEFLQRDAATMRRWFAGAVLELHLCSNDFRQEPETLEASLRQVVTDRVNSEGLAKPGYALDFLNLDAVAECTHYSDAPLTGTTSRAGSGMETPNAADGDEGSNVDAELDQDYFSEYFIFQLETNEQDADVVMRHLRRHGGSVPDAVDSWRREQTRTELQQAAASSEAALQGPTIRLTASSNNPRAANDFWTDALAEQADCAICLQALTHDVVQLNNCSHRFHRSCITRCVEERFGQGLSCPLCRALFGAAAVVASVQQETASQELELANAQIAQQARLAERLAKRQQARAAMILIRAGQM